MVLRSLAFLLAVYGCAASSSAASLSVKPDSGVVLVWQQKSGAWVAVKDSAAVGYGDSLYLDDQYTARVLLGRGCTMFVRGELRLSISGADTAAGVYCDQGSLFFKRDAGAELSNVKIVLRGCTFTPQGTAAGIKFTRQGQPTVAVIAGSVKLESPKGEAIIVTPGNFGTFDPVAGAFKQGALPPETIVFLEKWSGTKLEQAGGSTQIQAVPAQDTGKKTTQAALAQPQKSVQPDAVMPATTPAAAGAQPAKASLEKPVKQEAKKASAEPPKQAQAPAASPAEKKEVAKEEKPKEEKKPEAPSNAAPGITWEVSAGSVTVDGKQWTRIAISPDIPIWKFGICLDLEAFIDPSGNFSNKGWQFDKDNALQSVFRKIRYIRFGHESDPLFAKVGGLSNVTLGYGFVVDRFTNMLHYPDQKLLGMQLYLNNITPLGVTLQTMVADFNDFKNNGGILAGRLAVCPMKMTGIPLLSDLSVGATYGVDLNEYAPARMWDFSLKGPVFDRDMDQIPDSGFIRTIIRDAGQQLTAAGRDSLIKKGEYDTLIEDKDAWAGRAKSRYALFGADLGIPLIKTTILGLDIYGQAAVVADTVMFKKERTGWGFGAPGVALRAGPLTARVEYRHIRGSFLPGYFGPYYYDERIVRDPVETRSQSIRAKYPATSSLNGVFGTLGFNIVNVVLLDGTYQYLMGKNDAKDQRLEASCGLGDALLKRIPKITKAEVYFYKTDIGSTDMRKASATVTYDKFFDETPSMYYGYRIGIGITQGASIIFDTRYGYTWQGGRLVPNNNMILQTAVTF
jgi:hypothetical protein